MPPPPPAPRRHPQARDDAGVKRLSGGDEFQAAVWSAEPGGAEGAGDDAAGGGAAQRWRKGVVCTGVRRQQCAAGARRSLSRPFPGCRPSSLHRCRSLRARAATHHRSSTCLPTFLPLAAAARCSDGGGRRQGGRHLPRDVHRHPGWALPTAHHGGARGACGGLALPAARAARQAVHAAQRRGGRGARRGYYRRPRRLHSGRARRVWKQVGGRVCVVYNERTHSGGAASRLRASTDGSTLEAAFTYTLPLTQSHLLQLLHSRTPTPSNPFNPGGLATPPSWPPCCRWRRAWWAARAQQRCRWRCSRGVTAPLLAFTQVTPWRRVL